MGSSLISSYPRSCPKTHTDDDTDARDDDTD